MGDFEDTARALFPPEKIAETTAPGKFPDVDAIRQAQQEKVREVVGDLPVGDPLDENQVDEPDKVPAAYSDYDLSMIENANPELTEWYQKTAYEHGLTKKQAADMAVKYDAMVRERDNKELIRYGAEMERINSVCSSWDQEHSFDFRNARIDPASVDKVLPGFSSWIRAEALQGSVMLARLVTLIIEGKGIQSESSATKTDFSRAAEKLYPQSK